MTNDNQRRGILAEVARGDEAMREAETLLAAKLLAGAVSRAYYAAFHYARAMLLTLGEEARTHGGLTRLLHRDIVATGKLDPDIASLFSQLQRFRQDADYTAEFVFTAAGAAGEVRDARTFVGAARKVLEAGGWLSPAA
jgi:uncharacterized protein (UPF0332 family)